MTNQTETKKFSTILWLNVLVAVGMSTCVFTGQLKVVMDLPWVTLTFPAANIFFALLTFPITDIITEVCGKEEAKRTVWVGFLSQYLTIFIIEFSLLFPGDTSALAPFQAGGWKVIGGSSIAFLTAQFWDVFVFHWIKEKWTGEAHLWLRNNLSTCSSQFINSAIFITAVFGPGSLATMLPASMLVKWSLALLDTPFVYMGCNYLRTGSLFKRRSRYNPSPA